MSSDSEYEGLLIATRSRRANAGNKMQKLLQMELEEAQKRTGALDDDEINLLFQEDEEDEEFTLGSKKREEDEDMFSDSGDESSGASDAEAGEHELQRQERQKRKLSQKKKNHVPVIKRAKTTGTQKTYKSPSGEINAESLLAVSRRTSKRSAVVANKLKVYESLTKAEKRRKLIQEKLRKQREKQNIRPLTQEERLKIAEETEKFNISSLNKYKEQEISKKQTRMAMQLREKMKFKDGEKIIRWISTQWEVSPLVEIEDRVYWEQYTAKRDKTKKKYVRRKKAQIEADKSRESSTSKEGTPIKQEEDQTSENTVQESLENNDEQVNVTDTQTVTNDSIKNASAGESDNNDKPEDLPSFNPTTKAEVVEVEENKSSNPAYVNTEESSTVDNSNIIPNCSDSNEMKNDKTEVAAEELLEDQSKSLTEDSYTELPKKENETEISFSTKPDSLKEAGVNDMNSCNTSESIKHISFADEDQISVINSEDPPILVQTSTEVFDKSETSSSVEQNILEEENNEPEIKYEGPVQRVGKNFLILYTFPDGPFTPYPKDFKKVILGDDWLLPSKARPDEVKTITKITIAEEEEPLQCILTPDTSILDKFPRFGEFDKKTLRTVKMDTTKKDKIEIKTEAPTGVFLPNGIRKNCLITNKECKYFDPKNGVPYSDVEAIKTIQQLQEYYDEEGEALKPRFKWFGFGRGGIFLDVLQRPAKGVPEGFI